MSSASAAPLSLADYLPTELLSASEFENYEPSVSFDESDYDVVDHLTQPGWGPGEYQYLPIDSKKTISKDTIYVPQNGANFGLNDSKKVLIKEGANIELSPGVTLALNSDGLYDKGLSSAIRVLNSGQISISGNEETSFVTQGDSARLLYTKTSNGKINVTVGSFWGELSSTTPSIDNGLNLIDNRGSMTFNVAKDFSIWANLENSNRHENSIIYNTGTLNILASQIVAGYKQGSEESINNAPPDIVLPIKNSVFYLTDGKVNLGDENTELLAAINGDNGFYIASAFSGFSLSAQANTIYIYGRDRYSSVGIYASSAKSDSTFTTDNLIIDNVADAIVVSSNAITINAIHSRINGNIDVCDSAELIVKGNNFIQNGLISASSNSTLEIVAKNLYINSTSTLDSNDPNDSLPDVLKVSDLYAEAKLTANNANFVGNITNSGLHSKVNIAFGSNSSITGDVTTSSLGTSTLSLGSNSLYLGTLISKEGTTSLSLGDSSTFNGSTQLSAGNLSLTLGNNAQWLADKSSSLTNLTLGESATVSLQTIPAADEESATLSIKQLVGSEGIFNLAADAESLTVSTIELGETSEAGEHFVGLHSTDSFTDKEEFNIFFAHDDSGNVVFKPTETLTEAGLLVQSPELTALADAEGGNDWFITKVSDKPGPTPESVYDNLANSYLLWRSFVDSTKERFGELREGAQSGVWGRVTAGSLSNGSLRNQYQSYRLGMDAQLDDRFSLGVMIEHHVGDIDGQNGKGDMYASSGALYALFASDSGWYADGGLRFGEMKYEYTNEAMAFDKYDFKSRAFGAWFESGFEIPVAGPVSITPHVGIQYGNFESERFNTRNGLAAEIDPYSSLIWTLGADVAYKTDWVRLIASADVRTEECASVSTRISNGDTVLNGEKNWSDTWVDFGVSAIVHPTDKSQLWLNFTRSAFADLEEEWRINAGARYLFW